MSNTNRGTHEMKIDYHIHSDFSADCKEPMEETIKAAINKGMTEICFTEHIDYEYPDPTITFDLDILKYSEKITEMQGKYAGVIQIKKGVEIGVQPHLLEKYQTLLDQETFDFIICSEHTTAKTDLHSGEFFKTRTPKDAYQLYYEELLYCVKNFDEYNVLGHLDLVKRYQKPDINADFTDIIQQIFKTIIPKGKGIEVNTSGVSYGLDHAMPSDDILRLYKDCGGEIITIGSDSHYRNHVGRHFKENIALLEEIGFSYLCTFDNRKPIFHSIDSIA